MIKVKICGITSFEDADAAQNAGADALGFIFTRKSPRYIVPRKARKIISRLEPFIAKVGVFVNENEDIVRSVISEAGLTAVQLHGSEPAYYAHRLNKIVSVIKVFFAPHREQNFSIGLAKNKPLAEAIRPYNVNSYLFDVRYEDKQRDNARLPLPVLAEIKEIILSGCRVIISSGLTVETVTKVSALKPYAVDVSSGVEDMPGKKNHALMREFIKNVKG